MEKFQLKEHQMKKLGVLVSKRRAKFRIGAEKEARAAGTAAGLDSELVEQAAKKISQRGATKPPRPYPGPHQAYRKQITVGRRKRLRKRGMLKL